MHIDSTNHEHGTSGKVYAYEADYQVGEDAVSWTATLSQGGVEHGHFSGSLPLTSPAIATLAEQAVRDEIVKRIDAFEDQHGASLDGAGGRI